MYATLSDYVCDIDSCVTEFKAGMSHATGAKKKERRWIWVKRA